MLRYFISSCLLLLAIAGWAQESKKDSIKYKEKYGLRVGLDLIRPARTVLSDEYKGFEIVGDYRISKKFYIAAEIGTEDLTVDDDRFNYTTTGSYLKVGFDYNFYENWFGMQNTIYGGLRAGIGTHSQKLNSYSIYNTDQYWEEGNLLGNNPDILKKYDGLSGKWIEAVFGFKVEVLNNFYLGVSARVHSMISQSTPDTTDNFYIPGFNKVTTDNSFGASINYTISYLIPLYKKDK